MTFYWHILKSPAINKANARPFHTCIQTLPALASSKHHRKISEQSLFPERGDRTATQVFLKKKNSAHTDMLPFNLKEPLISLKTSQKRSEKILQGGKNWDGPNKKADVNRREKKKHLMFSSSVAPRTLRTMCPEKAMSWRHKHIVDCRWAHGLSTFPTLTALIKMHWLLLDF